MVGKEEKKDVWEVKLVIQDENQPPLKVVSNNETEESLDLYAALAKILTNQEQILQGLLG